MNRSIGWPLTALTTEPEIFKGWIRVIRVPSPGRRPLIGQVHEAFPGELELHGLVGKIIDLEAAIGVSSSTNR